MQSIGLAVSFVILRPFIQVRLTIYRKISTEIHDDCCKEGGANELGSVTRVT